MTYSASYFTARESWRDWRIEANWLITHAHSNANARVLEIGCGGGGVLRLLRARGALPVGVDTLDIALNLAQERLDADTDKKKLHASASSRVPLILIGADNALPFRAESFDAIIGQHVIEHLSAIDAALREWSRLLKPDGRLVLATPNARYPDPAHFADADHAHIFSPDELCGLVERANLIVESCVTIFPYLSPFRPLRACGILAHRVFQAAPYFSSRGRTILLAARKTRVDASEMNLN